MKPRRRAYVKDSQTLRRFILVLTIIWLVSFGAGCTVKAAYETFGGPEWLNSVIVGFFVALGLCCMALTLPGSALVSGDRFPFGLIGKIVSIAVSILFLLVGLLSFWRVYLNLIDLLNIH